MWNVAGQMLKSRLILGTARYPSPQILERAVHESGAECVTVSLRRQSAGGGEGFWEIIRKLGVRVLPNTAGCRSVAEVLTTAKMAREIFDTPWIKLETVGDEYTLQPDPFTLVEAAGILIREGFEVFPYMTDDLVVADRLVSLGCRVLMPWASPIGSGRGVVNPWALKTMRARFPHVSMIVDAGLGAPSHAAHAMELGCDGVILNTAVALADDPIHMARGFSLAVQAGRLAHEAGLMPARDFAEASTPTTGLPFWHEKVQ